MSIFCFNNDQLIYFPYRCASMWAEVNLEDYVIDQKTAREHYQAGHDPLLVTRRPLDYWVSAYRWCTSEENRTGVVPTTFRNFCQLAINDFQAYCETRQTTEFTFRSWAGPNVQLNAALDEKKAVVGSFVDLGNSDEFYSVMNNFKGRLVSRTPVNVSSDLGNTHYVLPDLYNKGGITRRLTMLFNTNKFWAGYNTYDG